MNTTVLLLHIIIVIIIIIIICPILSPIAPIAMIDYRRRAVKNAGKENEEMDSVCKPSFPVHPCFLSCVFYSRIFDQPTRLGSKTRNHCFMNRFSNDTIVKYMVNINLYVLLLYKVILVHTI